MKTIETEADVLNALKELRQIDKRLHPVIDLAGDVPIRRRAPGFEGLAEIVVSQQLSKASANAIWTRLLETVQPLDASRVLDAEDERLRSAGLSAGKVRTLRACANAERNGLDFDALADKHPDDAMTVLTAIKGIGPWTAEVYLLFCLGHPDIFPAGDLALQHAVRDALGLDERPGDKALREIASAWSPHRGVAARLFWRYYGVTRRRDAVPV